MSSWSTPPRTARYAIPLVGVLSLLSLSTVSCGAGAGAPPRAGASPRAGDGHDGAGEDTAARGDIAEGAEDGRGSEEHTADGDGDGPGSEASGPTPIVSCASGEAAASDPYEIHSRSVEGDVLRIAVTYGGGCAQHDFRLCYEPALLDTDPVQINLRLDHDAHGEACRRIDREVLELDLRPLRDRVHPDSSTIVLHLGEQIVYDLRSGV